MNCRLIIIIIIKYYLQYLNLQVLLDYLLTAYKNQYLMINNLVRFQLYFDKVLKLDTFKDFILNIMLNL